ncbi:MAG: hypothetical protein C0518_03100 [Opitutus sp.]|nr:hypothetical protein [Opitutus sp.]
MRIVSLSEIKLRVSTAAAIAAVEEGFVAYSRGEVTVPPVGHLGFEQPPGDVHIKYGHRRGDDMFVVKIASGFYDNPKLGLPSSNGLMLVFSAQTGAPEAVLLDEGWLTDLRTAAAGAVAAKHLAPRDVGEIGIVGAGVQARWQLDLLRHVTSCRRAVVWARDFSKAHAFAVEGFEIEAVRTLEELAARARLIVTTTPSREALLRAEMIHPGTHITAVGADAPGKQELDPALFARAAVRAVDSRSQCLHHGDSAHALRAGLVRETDFAELGEIIAGTRPGRTDENQITIADLTGLAIQDIQVAKLAAAN